jgi:hypothetical protein
VGQPHHAARPGAQPRGPPSAKARAYRFDGQPEADNDLAAAERKLLTVLPDPAEVAKLAPRYSSAALGEIALAKGEKAIFDFGEFKSEIASRRNPDGSVSVLTTVPGFDGLEFVVGAGAGNRTLVFRDAQHEYTFTER